MNVLRETMLLEKPHVPSLRNAGFTCVDMHVHTTCSDGAATVAEALRKARLAGFGLAVTDHNTPRGSQRAFRKGVFTIPAMEVNAQEGPHVLLYFYTISELLSYHRNYIENRLLRDPHGRTTIPLQEILESARSYNCITAAPHPFGVAWSNLDRYVRANPHNNVMDLFDCIEILSNQQFLSQHSRALKWAQTLHKPQIGGSDGHTLSELGSVLTCTKADSVRTFLKHVVAGKALVVGQQYPLHKLGVTALQILAHHLKHGWFDFGFFFDHWKKEAKRIFRLS